MEEDIISLPVSNRKRQRNDEYIKYGKKYYLKNLKMIKIKGKLYRMNDDVKKKKSEYAKNFYKNNKEWFKKYHQDNRKILNEKMRKYNYRNKIKVYNHYSNYDIKCNCCGERHIEFLSVDHINNDGAEHRKTEPSDRIHRWLIKNNFPLGFQILCMNCNMAKGWDKEHLCPHQKELNDKIQEMIK